MNTPIITRCGFRCDLCPAFRENVERDDRREGMSKGFSEYYNVTVSPDELFCDGCLDESPGARRVDTACKVRPCTITQGYENCAHCEKKGCAKLKTRLVDLHEIEKKLGSKVPRRDYLDSIKPFENKKLLAELSACYTELPRLLNKEIIPTMIRIHAFIGKGMGTFLDKIDRYMIENACGGMIVFDSDGHGWNITYRRKGKNLASMYPEKKGITALIVLGKRELDEANSLARGVLDESIVKIIRCARLNHDGKTLWIPITNGKVFTGVSKLLEIKVGATFKPSRARR